MNKIITQNQAQNKTMSHIQIASFVNSRNDKVKQSIERLAAKGVITFTPVGETNSQNKNVTVYHVNERDSYIVVAQLSPEFTAALVDAWQNLKNKSSMPALPDFNDPIAAARAWADAKEAEQEANKKLELAAPKVAFVDNLVARDNLMNASQVGQKHNMSAVALNKILSELGVYNRAIKRTRVFSQWFIDKGFGKVKKTEQGFDQALFTLKGEVWINEKLITEGVV